ncbi:MAG TPA: TIGR04141 family sporadically distributed protein [Candidatus Faecimonas intestinavium]|nr:TIGR04141 family sporadically distributed protein [Candidatus Faecimonas intestinavium]
MSSTKKKSNKITIYLIKDTVEYNKVLKDCAYEKILCQNDKSITYYVPTKQNVPIWLSSYFNITADEICNANAKVISLHRLTIKGEEKIFAIPFGSGKILLNDDVIEEQFGIKVLLNSVPKDGFRQLSISNYGGDHRTKNEQTPKKTNISEFGFDIHSDFLRKATAKSEEDLFNKNTITGGDLLSVSVPVNISNINDFLIECYNRYKSDNYKKNFAWLDNIKEVKEKKLKIELDQELLKIINEHDFSRVWTAVPEVIEWENILDFRYRKQKEGYDDIEIRNIIELFPNENIPNIDILKRRQVYAMTLDGEELYKWKIYNCIIAEIEYKNNVYCLNFGKWYKVNKAFVKTTNEYYDEIPLSNIDFPFANNEREDKYNEELHKHMQNSILMDKETVRMTGMGRSSIEVCDVLTDNKELIHVKKNGGSSYLSHLFNQASVSGEILLDANFRNEVNKKMKKIIFSKNFISSDYTIVLAIITNSNTDRPKIPFFSKVSIQYAIEGLKRKGYNIEIKNIYNKK